MSEKYFNLKQFIFKQCLTAISLLIQYSVYPTYEKLYFKYAEEAHKNIFLVDQNHFLNENIPYSRWGSYKKWYEYRSFIFDQWRKNPVPHKALERIRIPKRIFFIWLTGHDKNNTLPERYRELIEEYKQNLPHWEIVLIDDVYVTHHPLKNQNLYDNAKNLAEKSDILRIELLYRYGGIYIDVDCELKNFEWFDIFNSHYDFYLSIEPLGIPGNCFIASVPHHPLLRAWIKGLNNWIKSIHKNKNLKRKFPGNLLTFMRTGPWYLLEVIHNTKGTYKGFHDLFLPSVFVHGPPDGNCEHAMVHHLSHSNWLK